MSAIPILFTTACLFIIAYRTYGTFLSKKIFHCDPTAPVPSKTHADNTEYVASKKSVMFGHHFTSIAGTGPIVGPAIGVIWGWVPALCWVVVGSIFMCAVHDFSVLMLSIRNQGKSIAEITGRYMSPSIKRLFYLIIFLALWIVIAIFGLIMALIFAQFPPSVWPIWLEIPIALLMGHLVFKHKKSLVKTTLIAITLMNITVIFGHYNPVTLTSALGNPPTAIWTIIL